MSMYCGPDNYGDKGVKTLATAVNARIRALECQLEESKALLREGKRQYDQHLAMKDVQINRLTQSNQTLMGNEEVMKGIIAKLLNGMVKIRDSYVNFVGIVGRSASVEMDKIDAVVSAVVPPERHHGSF